MGHTQFYRFVGFATVVASLAVLKKEINVFAVCIVNGVSW